LLLRQPGANLGLEGSTPQRGVDDPGHVNTIYPQANARQVKRQRVHDKTGVDAGAQYGLAGSPGQRIKLGRLGGVGQPGEGKLFSRGNDIQPRFKDFNDLRLEEVEIGTRRVQSHVSLSLRQGLVQLLGHEEAKRPVQADHLADILAHPGNIIEEDVILASKNEVFLELSARNGHKNGNRHVAELARKFGAKLLVNTDAHSEKDLLTQEQAFNLAKEAGLSDEEALVVVRDNPKELIKRLKI